MIVILFTIMLIAAFGPLEHALAASSASSSPLLTAKSPPPRQAKPTPPPRQAKSPPPKKPLPPPAKAPTPLHRSPTPKPSTHRPPPPSIPTAVQYDGGTPGGSVYLCIVKATSPIGQGCDASSQNAFMSFMGKYAADVQKLSCIRVMGGVCIRSDFVSIQKGLDIISGKTSGLMPSITSWLKSSNIYGIEMTVQIRGYYDMKYMGDAPDATAFFSCRAQDKTMVPLPSSVCHK